MRSCLVVDDSKVIRKVARHILETLNFTVEEAEDGREAMARCQASMPDVILLDWNMPVMSGMEFLKALRQSEHEDQPKVVFCTTENDIAHIRAAIAATSSSSLTCSTSTPTSSCGLKPSRMRSF